MNEERRECALGLNNEHDCHADTPECIITIVEKDHEIEEV